MFIELLVVMFGIVVLAWVASANRKVKWLLVLPVTFGLAVVLSSSSCFWLILQRIFTFGYAEAIGGAEIPYEMGIIALGIITMSLFFLWFVYRRVYKGA